jgi:hypothetical protein
MTNKPYLTIKWRIFIWDRPINQPWWNYDTQMLKNYINHTNLICCIGNIDSQYIGNPQHIHMLLPICLKSCVKWCGPLTFNITPRGTIYINQWKRQPVRLQTVREKSDRLALQVWLKSDLMLRLIIYGGGGGWGQGVRYVTVTNYWPYHTNNSWWHQSILPSYLQKNNSKNIIMILGVPVLHTHFPPRKNEYILVFPPERSVYTHFPPRKDQYILIFPSEF